MTQDPEFFKTIKNVCDVFISANISENTFQFGPSFENYTLIEIVNNYLLLSNSNYYKRLEKILLKKCIR